MTRKYPKIVDQSGYFAKVLLIDEIGLPADQITDDLLSQGCLVYLITKTKITDNSLSQKPNLFIVQPNEAKTISLLDNLIIIQNQGTDDFFHPEKYPKAYRTAIFCCYQNQPKINLSDSVQLICFEEIIDESTNNKLDRLINLRKEGNRIDVKVAGDYYPVTPRCLGKTIGQIVNRELKEEKLWLKSAVYPWSMLVQQINQVVAEKPNRDIIIELPIFSVTGDWTMVNYPADIDLIIKERLVSTIDRQLVLPKIDRFGLKKIVGSLPLFYKKLVGKIPSNTKISRSRFPLWRLVVPLLLLINLIIFGHFWVEKRAATTLKNYYQKLSALSDNANLGDSVSLTNMQKVVGQLTFWHYQPFNWLLSAETKHRLPSLSVDQNLLAFLTSLEDSQLNEVEITNKWLSGRPIGSIDWDNLKADYLQATELLLAIGQRENIQAVNFDLKLNKKLEAVNLWQTLLTDKPIRLLVLVQNNYELRPTGGLVSAYGLITLQNGQKPTWEFFDSSVLDAKTVGRVQPPVEITNQLGENIWYFRDINWEPDLALSADRAIWYYENAEKALVDGVLVTDASFWLNLSQWSTKDETIDQNQFFADLVAASAGQKNTFSAGQFLADFADQTFSRLLNYPINQLSDLFYNSFENKDLALYLKDIQTQTLLARLGWDGKIKKFVPPNSKAEIYADYFMLNEANVGINLVNRFVSRRVEQQISFTNQQKESVTTLIYQNTSSLSGWPGGIYQAYVRLYLPNTVNLRSITMKNQGDQQIIDPVKINGSQFDDKAVFGWRIEVNPGEQVSYTINYTDKSFDVQKKIGTYLLLVQKQLGMEPFDYYLTVKSDQSRVPLRSIPSGTVLAGAVSLGAKIASDQIFQVDFGQ